MANELDNDDLRELDEELAVLDPPDEIPELDDEPEQADEQDADDEAKQDPVASQPDTDTAQLKAEIESLKRAQEAEEQARRQAEAEAAERARLAQLEARETELRAKRREAMEADDMDAYDKLDEELADVRLQRRLAPKPEAPQPSAPTPPEAAKAWAAANPRFYSDPQFNQAAMRVNQQLIDEGLNPDHPRFYQELDKRLNRTPRMNGDNKQGAPVSRTVRQSSGESVEKKDRSWMEKFGIDPNDKKAQQHWQHSKRQVQRMTRGAR